MRRESTELELTITYVDAEQGWTTASVPAVPGTISTGKTREEARQNVLDTLRMMLTTPPREALDDAVEIERVRVRLELSPDRGRSIDG